MPLQETTTQRRSQPSSSVCKNCLKRPNILVLLLLVMGYVQSSRSRYQNTSSCWTLTETLSRTSRLAVQHANNWTAVQPHNNSSKTLPTQDTHNSNACIRDPCVLVAY